MNLIQGRIRAAFLAGLVLLPLLSAAGVSAAPFSSGSNGSYGPLTITSNTVLDLPPDGVFHCTTVTVNQNMTLSFRRNPLNTPVYILATSNVTVNGTIDVSGSRSSGAIPGAGGPGGFDGGLGGSGTASPASRGGDGQGPGRGLNVGQMIHGAYATAFQQNSNSYGNVLIVPLIGGSGGAGSSGNPGQGGGGGGGAILIASDTSIVINGAVRAVGANGAGTGSGGAVRLVAPNGGGGGNVDVRAEFGGASEGRIRVDTETQLAFRNLSYFGALTRGNRMFVFPAATPKLHIIEAAGQTIPVGNASAVTVEVPAGSPATQTVKIRGEGFTGVVPIQLVVIPEHSASTVIDLNLNASANPPEISTTVTLPVAQLTRLEAWTK